MTNGQSSFQFGKRLKHAFRSLVRLVVRQYPIYSGVMRLVNSRLLKFLTSEHEIVVTTLKCGAKIVVDLNDYCARPIYYWGDHDARITELCVSTLRPGDVMLDIGANYGEIALAAAVRVGPTGAVHAFEPNPVVAEMSGQSAALNGFANFVVHKIALGSSNGTEQLTFREGYSCAATLRVGERAAVDRGLTERVEVRAAGEYIQNLGLSSLSVVKVDCEGMDSIVLQSMRGLLALYLPRVIAFESLSDGTPFFERDAVKLLTELGYRIHQVKHKPAGLQTHTARILKNADVGPEYDFVATLA